MLASGLPAVLVVPFDRCSETLSGPNGCDRKEPSDAAGKAPSGLAREASPPATSETLEGMIEARVAGEVLAVEASRDGLLLLCVSVRHVVILGCSAGLDWTPVGQCARPKLGKTSSYAKVAWGPDGHNVVVCSDSGYAEFYSLTQLEVPCLRLPAPSWETTGGKELKSSRQVEISFRTAVRNTVEGERIMLQSVAANRMWLLMGTGRGSIIRVLWTGEVVDDREVDLFPFGQGEDGEHPTRGAVVDVCIGWRQRIGFIADGGACGVYVQKNANSIYYLKTKGAKSIALHRMRPLALVGLENGDVEVYAVGSKSARKLRTIELPVQDLPSYLALRVKEGTAAATIKWAPDGSSHFAVGYVGLGFIIWSSSGCRTTTLFLPDHTEPKARTKPEISDNLVKLPAPAFALAAQGTALVCGAVLRTADCKASDMVLNSLELVKTCLASGQLASGSTSMCLQGWNHVLILQNQEWDVDSLAWHRIDLPSMYINDNWPIQLVAANVSGSHIAVAGKHGVAVHSNVTKRWRLFGEKSEETKIRAKLLFWWGDEVICIVTRDDYTRVWELLCFSSEDLSMHAILGRVALPGRPLAVDTLFVEGMTVLAFTDRISLYRMCFHSEEPTDLITEESPLARGAVDQTSDGDDAPEGPGPSTSPGIIQKSSSQGSALSVASDASARPRTKELFVIRRPVSASSKSHKLLTLPMEGQVEFIDSIPLGFGEQDDEKMAPVNLSLLPCGTTRRGGCPIKIPKCVLLSSDGTLFLFDIDDGSRSVVSRDVLQIFPQSWSKIEQADDVVLHSLLQQKQESYAQYHQSSAGSNGVAGNGGGTKGKTESALSGRASKLPAVLLYTLWLMDHRGIRLWLPALDITGEFLNTRCAETYTDVHPIGILESHGLVVGLTQRARALTNLRLPCYELATRVTPTTHALLSWLIRAERQDLAAQVLVQARTHLPLFLETLDLFLFGAVETDYKNQHNQHFVPLLPLVVQVLRTGKVSHVVDPRTFDKLVITSARKMESSRWELFFASAGNPEQIFNNAVYHGDLKVAASSMIISDHFSPQTSAKRLALLSHSATLQGDSALLEQISTYQSAR